MTGPLSIECPTCHAPAGQRCRQPTIGGFEDVGCAVCDARPGQECQQAGDSCHQARGVEARWLAEGRITARRPARTPARIPSPAAAGRWNGNKPAAASGTPVWLLEDDRPVVYDVVLHADTYSNDVTVTLSDSARDAITTAAARVGHLVETGGVLVGLRPSVREIVITDAGTAGANARRTRTSYRCDGAHDQGFVDELEQMTGGALKEVGSWHSHPVAGADQPSPADRQAWVASLHRHGAARDIAVIVTPGGRFGDDWRKPQLAAWTAFEASAPDARRPWYRVERAHLRVRS